MTKGQRLRSVAHLPADASRVLHTFADGWSIRQLQAYDDMLREGALMLNCLRDQKKYGCYQGKDLDAEAAEEIYSLRDPHNLPHVSFTYEDEVVEALGMNNHPPKPEYLERIESWASAERQSSHEPQI